MFPKEIYSTRQVRELDRIAIQDHGIPGYELMQRAGLAAFTYLQHRWPDCRSIQVYCGIGNNGGDGYVIARLASEAGLNAEIIQLGDPGKITGDALKAREDYLNSGALSRPIEKADVIVDAIFGTGLTRPPEGEWRKTIKHINLTQLPVLAIDVPSGLDSDTGMALETAVMADATLSFIGMKQGLLTGNAGDYTGTLRFDSLDIPSTFYKHINPVAEQLTQSLLPQLLPPRKPSTHKGDCGHALIIGGSLGMQGAAQMTAEACARSGAGLTTLATESLHHARPELMSALSSDHKAMEAAMTRANVIAIGPGLGISEEGSKLLEDTIRLQKPLVIDADALTLLADLPQYDENWILTPHPGEAARLLGTSTNLIQQDRFAAVKAIQQRYGGVCILKGFGTLVYDGNALFICTDGNPGMASGGMGDVLTGIICGLLAQRLSLFDAAKVGVYIHAKAADQAAAENGERGMLATDLFTHIRHLVNPAINQTP